MTSKYPDWSVMKADSFKVQGDANIKVLVTLSSIYPLAPAGDFAISLGI
jgi:hypothetical protein